MEIPRDLWPFFFFFYWWSPHLFFPWPISCLRINDSLMSQNDIGLLVTVILTTRSIIKNGAAPPISKTYRALCGAARRETRWDSFGTLDNVNFFSYVPYLFFLWSHFVFRRSRWYWLYHVSLFFFCLGRQGGFCFSAHTKLVLPKCEICILNHLIRIKTFDFLHRKNLSLLLKSHFFHSRKFLLYLQI